MGDIDNKGKEVGIVKRGVRTILVKKKINKAVDYYHSDGLLGWGVFFLVIGFLLVIIILRRIVLLDSDLIVVEWEFLRLCGFYFVVLILIDLVRVLFSSLVFVIGGCVLIFRVDYIRGDKYIKSFSYLTVCFILVMNVLIFIPYLVFLLIGWDLLGIISFLLVIHYQGKGCVSVGMITVLVNRIGDIFLLISIGLRFDFVG